MGLVNKVAEQLSRTTASTRFIPEVDGVRFVAIFMVITYHVSGYFLVYGIYAGQESLAYHKYLFDFGARGVDLFFTLSGTRYLLDSGSPYMLWSGTMRFL